ncbi:MAG: hypothetical protein V4591_05440 [Bdellovibrionota bacterium]
MVTTSLIKKTTFCLLVLLCTCTLTSCGVAGRKIQLPEKNDDGGGSGSGSGSTPYVPPASSITADKTNLADFFSTNTEEVGSLSEQVKFSAMQNTVSNFSIRLNAAINPSDWLIVGKKTSDSTPCGAADAPIVLQAGDSCVVTITFTPRSLLSYSGKFNVELNYSFTDSKNVNQNPKPISLLSQTFQALSTSIQTHLDQNYMSSFKSGLFVGSAFVGLTSSEQDSTPRSLFTFDLSKTTQTAFKQIATNVLVENFSLSPIGSGNIFYKWNANRYSYIISVNSTTPGKPGVPGGNLIGNKDDAIIQVTTDHSKVYGSDANGNVYSVNGNGALTLIGAVPLPIGLKVTNNINLATDLSGNGSIYGIYIDNSQSSQYFLCKISAIDATDTKYSFSNNNFKNISNIIAYNNNIFLLNFGLNDEQKGAISFMWFNKNLEQNAYIPSTILADSYSSPVYDKENNILYLISKYKSIYTLTEIDFKNKLQSSYNFSAQDGTISAPFLTTGSTSTSTKTSNIVVVSSSGYIYTFTKNKLTPYSFNDQSSIYPLPKTSTTTFYSKLAAIYNGNIFIPTFDSSTQEQNNYLFNLNW